jgi:hypothetical protein
MMLPTGERFEAAFGFLQLWFFVFALQATFLPQHG